MRLYELIGKLMGNWSIFGLTAEFILNRPCFYCQAENPGVNCALKAAGDESWRKMRKRAYLSCCRLSYHYGWHGQTCLCPCKNGQCEVRKELSGASNDMSPITSPKFVFFRRKEGLLRIAGVRDGDEIAEVPPLAATAGLWFLFLRHGMNKCIRGPD